MATEKANKPAQIEVMRNTELHLELDDEKIQAIRKCLETGRLTIKVQQADLSQVGRLQAAYEYD